MNKEILLVTSRLDIGGVAKSICLLANSLYDKGYLVRILSFSKDSPKSILNEHIRIYYIAGPDEINRSHNWVIKKFLALIFNIKLFLFFLFHQKYLVVAFRTDIIKVIARISKLIKLIIIGSERGNPSRFKGQEKLEVAESYNRCQSIVFQTERGFDCFKQLLTTNYEVIPNYCIIDEFKIPLFSNRTKNIVTCGVPSEDKGFDLLIRAFAIVKEAYPDYKLVIYGPINNYSKKLCHLVEELNLGNNVLLKGSTPFFYKDCYDASMYVLSSRNEGIPNTLIEALSVGLPSIACDCTSGGPSLLLDNGSCGLLVPVEDIMGLAKAIIYYIKNPIIAEQYGEKGKKGLDRFSNEVITQKWIKLLETI